MNKVLSNLKKFFNSKEKENPISLKDFSNYCKNNSLLIVITILLLALEHGSNLFYNNLGIDTQTFIELPHFTYNWLGIGRFGLLIERFLLNLTTYSSFYASILFFIFLILSNVILYYTIYKISNKDFGLINLCIPIIAFSHPIFVEQFVYMLQIAEISMAIFITCLATLFIFEWIRNKNIIYCIFGIICLVISFASYQTFVGLYITFAIFTFILMHEKMESLKSSFKVILKLLISFIIGFILYKFLIYKLPSNTQYIDDNFYWGTHAIKEILSLIKANIIDVLYGHGNYYNLGYLFGTILFIISIVYKIFKEEEIRKLNKIIWYVLSAIGLIASPFIMTVAIGHVPQIRAQLILPFSVSFLIMFACYNFFKNKWLKFIPLILIIYVFQTQMYMTQTLYYTDKMRNNSDIELAYAIIDDLREEGVKEGTKLSIIGHLDANLNPTCITGETVGISLFSMNYAVPPYYVNSNGIIIRLFKCLGYNYKEAKPEQTGEARTIAKDMPVWPEKGSILVKDDYVIVKISEDELPIE